MRFARNQTEIMAEFEISCKSVIPVVFRRVVCLSVFNLGSRSLDSFVHVCVCVCVCVCLSLCVSSRYLINGCFVHYSFSC